LEASISEVSALKLRPAQVAPLKLGCCQSCLTEVGIFQVGPFKKTVLKGSILKISPLEASTTQVSPAEVGIVQFATVSRAIDDVPDQPPFVIDLGSVVQLRVFQISPVEGSPAKLGALEIGLGQVYPPQVATAQFEISQAPWGFVVLQGNSVLLAADPFCLRTSLPAACQKVGQNSAEAGRERIAYRAHQKLTIHLLLLVVLQAPLQIPDHSHHVLLALAARETLASVIVPAAWPTERRTYRNCFSCAIVTLALGSGLGSITSICPQAPCHPAAASEMACCATVSEQENQSPITFTGRIDEQQLEGGVAEGVAWKSGNPAPRFSQRSPPLVRSRRLITARTRRVSHTIFEGERSHSMIAQVETEGEPGYPQWNQIPRLRRRI